jgi:hypothetical protein
MAAEKASMHLQCTRQLASGHAVWHENGEWGALLRLGERDVLHTVEISAGPDLFAFRRRELERLGWDRLVEADRERGDLVEGLPVAVAVTASSTPRPWSTSSL